MSEAHIHYVGTRFGLNDKAELFNYSELSDTKGRAGQGRVVLSNSERTFSDPDCKRRVLNQITIPCITCYTTAVITQKTTLVDSKPPFIQLICVMIIATHNRITRPYYSSCSIRMMLHQYLASVHNERSVLDDGLIGRLAADEHKVCGGVERLHGDTGTSLAIAIAW